MFRAAAQRATKTTFTQSLLHRTTLQSSPPLKTPFRHFSTSPPSSPSPTPTPSSKEAEIRKYIGYTALLLVSGLVTYYSFPLPENAKHKKANFFKYEPLPEDLHTISNWSGSGLSPNGIGLQRNGMVNLALMDKILDVDRENKVVRVQAGIRVQELVDGIKEHGLTLQNFASIREQQIGGIVQVGAHGTGARLPPIDEQVISMKLVTPAKGTIEVSKEKDPELFYLARCGLGGLGVVAEVTIQCVERHELVEHTFVSNIDDIKKNHKKRLAENKHLKYLWIPYTDTVVVVSCNPVSKWKGPPKFKPKYTKDEALQQLRDLYLELLQKYRTVDIKAKSSEDKEQDISELSFTELRDKILAVDPLDKDLVVKANQAEADFWRKSEGYRVGWNDEILGFDCGGQQWVSETCFPSGTLAKPSMQDLEYMEELKQLIQNQKIPAPAPIEQRWTARSMSLMSPASSSVEDALFSWVGIIMYLPTLDARQRKEITEEFFHYRSLTMTRLWDKYSSYEHWAKIEVPKDKDELAALQARLKKRFPVDAYNEARMKLDPNRILSNRVIEKLFPLPQAN
ncbi:hypothetical protein IFM89_013911 [Coptis chinensis]|uniref:FAD-binding PCMH-type domain-containing protein n=1 Tax=Coptis chinensis TaxID=261450 RepID=A0A835HHA9_9MAGN|nr:hypothetical protein IFM89_013911 [Coptis chinensis]